MAGNNVVYRVKDELWYSVNVQEWDGSEWKPYKVSEGKGSDVQTDDLQLEFVMLNPYIRQNLTYVEEHDNGDYSTVGR